MGIIAQCALTTGQGIRQTDARYSCSLHMPTHGALSLGLRCEPGIFGLGWGPMGGEQDAEIGTICEPEDGL